MAQCLLNRVMILRLKLITSVDRRLTFLGCRHPTFLHRRDRRYEVSPH
jgi:hypothetical protein